jgi:FtsP/CotA-like multicopper oxidase with cupredoxin domain
VSKGQRVGLIALAIVVVAVAFVVARPDDEDEKASSPPAAQTEGQTAESPGETTESPTATTETRPEHRVRLRGHEPVGGVQRIEVKSGEFVRIRVESDEPDEIHLHGYDIRRTTAPGAPARFSLRAEIEGEFELEGHEGGGTPVANLVVEPD